MSPRLPRLVLTTVVLMAALILPLPASATTLRSQPTGPALLEDLTQTFRHWFARLWSGAVEKNGAQIDPDGRTTPSHSPGQGVDGGIHIDPNG